ncbi:extracellular solute-binding protein [Cohnella silvisoli]|uniref:Extracellular solute-binding protein n=1 Tax=Cohnella silvisoli TaxID=2873699 RepID=A0ABV1KLT4_9BACL|nr:extracellular solute-binding protein [Cohnella silvisoli]MCD9020610.1 extracellular solute-binding protein [Cohnella silvisoli]
MTSKKANALILMICAAMVVLLIWIGGRDNKTDATHAEGISTGAPKGEMPGKYDPPITASFVRYIPAAVAADNNTLIHLPGETLDDNRWTRLYEQKLGIRLKYDWTAKDQEAYQQQMNIFLASNNIPDFIKVDALQLKRLAEADMITDLTEMFEREASELTKKTLREEGSAPFEAAMIDGRLMGLPNIDSSIDVAQFVWIRTDWLDNLGLQPPKTMDELVAIAKAFTNQDPDRNGRDDTVGLLLQKSLWGGFAGTLEGFFNGFHAYPNIWIKDSSGKLAYGSIQPEMKQALALLQQMYQAGYIDKEFAVLDEGGSADRIINGKSGMAFGQQWLNAWPIQIGYNKDPRMEWKAFPLVSVDDDPVKPSIQLGTNGWWVVKKGIAYPEAIVRMFNLFLETNWGATADFGTYYMPDNTESIWKLSPVTPTPPYKNLNAHLAIANALKRGAESELTGEAKVIYEKIKKYENGDRESWAWYAGYAQDGVFSIMNDYKEQNRFVMDQFTGVPTPRMVERLQSLQKLQNMTFTKIIFDNASIDEFDRFVENWNMLGGEDMTREVNERQASRPQ